MNDKLKGKGVWLGIAGLMISAGLMVAMGFTKPVHTSTRRPRRR